MEPRRSRFVERVRDVTRMLIEDLLEANQRLRLTLDVLGQDHAELRRQIQLLGPEERWRAEREQVLELLEVAARESRNFEEQFVEVERQHSSLATLYAASYALHASVESAAVLGAIQEVIINLVGSEQFAIVSVADGVVPLISMGTSSERLNGLALDVGIVAKALIEKRPLALPWGVPVDPSGVRVCVPLYAADRLLGLVLIFGFLPQKAEFSQIDHELFSLVGTHAATAMYCAELHSSRGRAA
jgi:hypothetical protein